MPIEMESAAAAGTIHEWVTEIILHHITRQVKKSKKCRKVSNSSITFANLYK